MNSLTITWACQCLGLLCRAVTVTADKWHVAHIWHTICFCSTTTSAILLSLALLLVRSTDECCSTPNNDYSHSVKQLTCACALHLNCCKWFALTWTSSRLYHNNYCFACCSHFLRLFILFCPSFKIYFCFSGKYFWSLWNLANS